MIEDFGRVGDADRAGGPADLSRQGVSTEGAHPSRGEVIEECARKMDEINMPTCGRILRGMIDAPRRL